MTTITLRAATPDEAELVAETVRAGFAEYQGTLTPPSSAHKEDADSIGQKMAKGGAILAYVDSELAGCVLFYPQDDYLYLGRLAVLPTFRRQGIGKHLVGAVEAKAHEMGITNVHLGVRKALPSNQAMFESLGYKFVSAHIHEGQTEPTFFVMEKHL